LLFAALSFLACAEETEEAPGLEDIAPLQDGAAPIRQDLLRLVDAGRVDSAPQEPGVGRVGLGGLSPSSNLRAALEGMGLAIYELNFQRHDDGRPDLEGVDCLLMPGGADIDPALYGEQPHESVRLISEARSELDFTLIQEALAHRLPILGICLGAQELNVALGGGLVQDIPSELEGALNHRAPHTIEISPESLMYSLYGVEELEVYSQHHQAVEDGAGLGEGLRVTARSADGAVEAIEALLPEPFILGLQYHPEVQAEQHGGLWAGFARACQDYRAAHPGRSDPEPPAPDVCVREGRSGRCMQIEHCDAAGGEREPGYCPGPAEIQCCFLLE